MTLPEGTKAMIFAAGLGTRLKPFTDQHPKALALVNHKPLLQRNIEYLRAAGIRDIVVNVHHFADQIISFLAQQENFGCNISISHEVEQPLETGGGLKKASGFFEGSSLPFIVMNADILTNMDLAKMYQFHREKKAWPHWQ
jgi:NDP-sugar pyrophosphorylase family protein